MSTQASPVGAAATSSAEWDEQIEQEALRQWEALQQQQQAAASPDGPTDSKPTPQEDATHSEATNEEKIVPAEELFGPVSTLQNEQIREANRQTLEEMGINPETQEKVSTQAKDAIHEIDVSQRVAAIHEKVRNDVEQARIAAENEDEDEDDNDLDEGTRAALEEWAAKRAAKRSASRRQIEALASEEGETTSDVPTIDKPQPSQPKGSLLDQFEKRLSQRQASATTRSSSALSSAGRGIINTSSSHETQVAVDDKKSTHSPPAQPIPSGEGAVSPNRESLPRRPLREVPKPIISQAEKDYLERRQRFAKLEVDPSAVTKADDDETFHDAITEAINKSDSEGLQQIMKQVREKHSPTSGTIDEDVDSPARGSTKSLLRLRRKYTGPTEADGYEDRGQEESRSGSRKGGRVIGPGEWDNRVKIDQQEIEEATKNLDNDVKEQKAVKKKRQKKQKLTKEERDRNAAVLAIQSMARTLIEVHDFRQQLQHEVDTWEKENLAPRKTVLEGGIGEVMAQLRDCEARLAYALPTLQKLRLLRYGAQPAADLTLQHVEAMSGAEREKMVRKIMSEAAADDKLRGRPTAQEQAAVAAAAERRRIAAANQGSSDMQSMRERARAARAAAAKYS